MILEKALEELIVKRSNMKKICVVTSARSEYGPIRWLLKALQEDNDLQLQLLVGGSHLVEQQGLTYKFIEEDGFTIDKKIAYLQSTDTSTGIVKSMGVCLDLIADAFDELNPDLIFVVGDRYELLPICTAALIKRIPIAHMSGGDVTEGAIDNSVRNAVTMMSDIHFPGNADSANNIVRMIDSSANIYNVGEPGLENLKRNKLMSRMELADSLNLDINKKWIVSTLHPETRASVNRSMKMAKKMCEALSKHSEAEVVITYANVDLGGDEMNEYYEGMCKGKSNFHIFKSLGQLRYNSMMKECICVVGNSSSGVFEAPFLGKPVVNIGNRQKGRYMAPCVFNVPFYDDNQIDVALNNAMQQTFEPDTYYGDGNTALQVVSCLKTSFKIQ